MAVLPNTDTVSISTLTPRVLSVVSPSVDSVAIANINPAFASYSRPNVDSVAIAAVAPSYAAYSRPGVESVAITALSPNPVYIVPPNTPVTTIYRCTLTGAADSLDDIVLPISSVQARYRNGADSYLQVVVPDAGTYSDAITARLNGQIVIDRGVRFIDGTEQLVELLRVDLETVSDAWGGANRSVSISGHATTTTTVPKTVTLEDVTYEASGTGKTRYRSTLDLNLRPGDTAVFDAQSIVVDTLSYTVGTSREVMEITEV